MNASFVPLNTMTTFSLRVFPRLSLVALLGGLLAGLFWAGVAQAELADRNAPMNAEADALRYEDARKLSVFTGNVVITKGSITIRGAQVEVRQDEQGNQFGTIIGNAAQPAQFRQKREGVDEFIEGRANRIEYDSKADTVRFLGSAVLRRFRGATLSDETSGNLISYNNRNDTFAVEGGAASSSASNPGGRVRAMLTPAPKGDASTPADPALLKPSGQVGEGQK